MYIINIHYRYNCIGWQKESAAPLPDFHSLLGSNGSQFGNHCNNGSFADQL